MRDYRLTIGRFRKPFGVKGEIHIELYSDTPVEIKNYSELFLDNSDIQIKLENIRPHGDHFVAKIANCNDCDVAKHYTNKNLTVQRSSLPDLPDGEFYWSDLEGLEVLGADSTIIGRVSQVFEAELTNLIMLRIQNESRETIVGFKLHETVDKVDLDVGSIQLLINL